MNILTVEGEVETPFKVWGHAAIEKGVLIGTNSPDGNAKTMENPERVAASLKIRINNETYVFDENDIARIKSAIKLFESVNA